MGATISLAEPFSFTRIKKIILEIISEMFRVLCSCLYSVHHLSIQPLRFSCFVSHKYLQVIDQLCWRISQYFTRVTTLSVIIMHLYINRYIHTCNWNWIRINNSLEICLWIIINRSTETGKKFYIQTIWWLNFLPGSVQVSVLVGKREKKNSRRMQERM